MTTIDDFRAEAAAIAARHPHVLDGTVYVNGFIVARDADATVNATTDDLLQVELHGSRSGSSALFVDPTTAVALFRALDEAVTVCEACDRAKVREDTAKCAGSGATLCSVCHEGGACSSRNECFHSDEFDDAYGSAS